MKKLKLGILLFIFILGCTESYDVPSAFNLNVLVTYPDDIEDGAPISDATVTVTNKQTNREYEATTNESGIATFEVRGGNYDVIVSLTEDHEIEVDGYPTRKSLIFSGSLTSQVITYADETLSIQTDYSIQSEGFVIKELYVSGSRTPEEQSYGADKFIEIYNNSDQVLYADGLCYGAVHPIMTDEPTPWVDDDGELLDRCPVWSFVPIVPGSGEDYPIQPGESFVIALSGLNHRDDPNGNPNSIDLSVADWEMYVEDGKYVDVPGVPNILMQRINIGTAIALSVRGQVSIIFRLPSDDLEEIFTDTDNFMVQPGGTYSCFMVPWSWIIDGVENVRVSDLGVYKRLRTSIDLGYIQFRGGYEGVSIRRKVKEVIDGRVVYQDTNNSSDDFLTNQEPQPGVISAE